MDLDDDLRGERSEQDGPARPSDRAGQDRRCGECGVKLSMYNMGPNCWQHTIGWPWRGPSARPRY